MEKENRTNVFDNLETPRSNLSMNFSVNDLSGSIRDLSLNIFPGSYSDGASNNSLGSFSESSSRTQEASPDNQETRLENSRTLMPTPLYQDNNIWALDQSTNNGLGNGSNYCYFSHNQEPGRNDNGEFLLEGEHLIQYATTVQGSRNLQNLLASTELYSVTEILYFASDMLNRVLDLVHDLPVIYYLMLHQQGCYVCSKLVDACNPQQLELILYTITRNPNLFVEICCNIHGQKVIKKLTKIVKNTPLVYYLLDTLYMQFNQLMINQVGLYVIISCLDCLNVEQNTFLCGAVIDNCLLLSTNRIGCVSVNNFIDRIQGSQRHMLLQLIANNAVFLSQDPWGNFVVRKVLGLENPIYSAITGATLRGYYATLSVQKWGCHVVEKCLLSQAVVIYVVDDLLRCSANQLLQIARDRFGNFVIQKALVATKKGNSGLHLILLKRLEPSLGVLQYGYGKNVYSLITRGVPINEII
ncbi:putative pumilio homolog 8, chloroplastic [Mercurialis annua]|uniref:putative pumilio homolog 8, chloroplastic n=1 Tax=Mercurialis annua TaxID=3986 RepID=UPI0021607BA2|nr:putative pumilio homolog 8, chloroplastic [Mercurialis annua]